MPRPKLYALAALCGVAMLASISCAASRDSASSSSSNTFSMDTLSTFLSTSQLSAITEALTNVTKAKRFLADLIRHSQPNFVPMSSLWRSARRQALSLRRKLRVSKARFLDNSQHLGKTVHREFSNARRKLQHVDTYFLRPLVRELLARAKHLDLKTLSRFKRRIERAGVAGVLTSARSTWHTSFMVAKVVGASVGYVHGEVYILVLAMLLLIVLQPLLLDEFLANVAAPLAFATGAWVCGRSIADLGLRRLSPWLAPLEDEGLVTKGVYAAVRHPLYAGIMLLVLGLALWSQSPARLMMATAMFSFLLNTIEAEEGFLREAYPSYWSYSERVTCKLIPGLI